MEEAGPDRNNDAAAAEELEGRLRGPWRQLASKLTPGWMTPRARGLGLLWLLVALCATNWVLVKDSGGLDAFTFSALRFTVAAAAFAPFLPQVCPICTQGTLACRQLVYHAPAGIDDEHLCACGGQFRGAGMWGMGAGPEVGRLAQALLREPSTLLPAGLELGIWTSAGYLTQALGLMTTDASRASFISTFTVLAVPFLASSRLGDSRPVKWTVWLSALAALAGVGLLENGGGSPPGVGDLWSLASAIFFGVQIFRTEKWEDSSMPHLQQMQSGLSPGSSCLPLQMIYTTFCCHRLV